MWPGRPPDSVGFGTKPQLTRWVSHRGGPVDCLVNGSPVTTPTATTDNWQDGLPFAQWRALAALVVVD